MSAIPLNGDVLENETMLKFIMNVNSVNDAKIAPYMEQITLMCFKILTDVACKDIDDSFKHLTGKFIKNVIMNTGDANVQRLQQFEALMSPDEKAEVAKYMPSE